MNQGSITHVLLALDLFNNSNVFMPCYESWHNPKATLQDMRLGGSRYVFCVNCFVLHLSSHDTN